MTRAEAVSKIRKLRALAARAGTAEEAAAAARRAWELAQAHGVSEDDLAPSAGPRIVEMPKPAPPERLDPIHNLVSEFVTDLVDNLRGELGMRPRRHQRARRRR